MTFHVTRIIYTSYKLLQIGNNPPLAAWGPKVQKIPPEVAELNHVLTAFGKHWFFGRVCFPDDVSPA